MFRWLLIGLITQSASKIYSQVLKKPVPDKVVVLTFDDAVKSHFTNVAPLLKQYGFGATFFVCEFPPDFADTSKYMTWQQIGQLSQMGFEIGNHTKNHVDVDKVSKEKLVEELSYIEDKCVSLQIPRPVSFAYPGYVTHPVALETLRERGYAFARIGGSRPYDPTTEHPALVPAFTTLANNKSEMMNAFTLAKGGKVVVLTIHGVPDSAHPWVTTPPKLFKEYMQYLHDNNYKVIAMNGLLEYIDTQKAHMEIEPAYPATPVSKKTKAAWIAAVGALVAMLYTFSRFRRKGRL